MLETFILYQMMRFLRIAASCLDDKDATRHKQCIEQVYAILKRAKKRYVVGMGALLLFNISFFYLCFVTVMCRVISRLVMTLMAN